MNHSERLARFQEDLEVPILVSKLGNIRYLSGFPGSSAYLLIWPDRAVFLTDGRYVELSEPLVAALGNASLEKLEGSATDALAGMMAGAPRFRVEADATTWDFARKLGDAFGGELEPSVGAVESMRAVKDADEVAKLRAAAAAGDAAFESLPALLEGADTEDELAWRLVSTMRASGGGPATWDPIVAAGANASRPHHQTGDSPIGSGLLLVDFGCVVDGYHSDMSRTVWVGPGVPEPEVERMHRAVAEAQEAAMALVAPGAIAGEVDAAARAVLDGHGYGGNFVHSTGHGVGLDIHEAPWLRKDGTDRLAAGHVITIEPGVYLPGVGGVRIEDMLVVTEGGAEVITTSIRGL